MKFASIILTCLLTHAACMASDTAYQALRVLGKERTQALLNKVISVEGRNGDSQPAVWKVVLDDPAARGGIREFEIASGRIASERTPIHAYSGVADNSIMDFRKLNLDSAGAFTIANREAESLQIGFDRVDYRLRCGDDTKTPVWFLQLSDENQRSVGTIEISAETGEVLSRNGANGTRMAGVEGADRQDEDADADTRESAPRKGLIPRVKKSLVRAGADLEEFFTGRRTFEKRFDDQ